MADLLKKSELNEVAEARMRADQAQLPPPGYRRNEVLARRGDVLAEEADRLNANPDRFCVDTEILAQEIEALRSDRAAPKVLTGQRSDYAYLWVPYFYGPRQYLCQVEQVKADGWRFVEREDPEAPELKGPDGYRRYGTSVLMRTTRIRHEAIEAETRLRTHGARMAAIDAAFTKHSGGLRAVDLVPNRLDQLHAAAAQERALRALDRRLRTGAGR